MKKILLILFINLNCLHLYSQNCFENELILQLNTGSWASEISWSITDSLGTILDSSLQVYDDWTTYYDTLCLTNGCYNFNMFDSYGDGWQGGEYLLFDSLNNLISSGGLQGLNGFSFFESNFININSLSCPVEGCILPFANNYNPLATIDDLSCEIISDNINLLFNWSDSTLPQNYLGGSYTDVYGVVVNNREYAIIGSTMGAHIIDITIPSQSYEAAFVPGASQGSIVTHRDYFHMDNYLYAVCDQGSSTLQIIDLSNLPDSISIVYDDDYLISRAHNIFIDTLNKKLYSTNGDVLDVSNPINPSLLFNMGFSFHDLYVENDTGYFNCFSNGLQIYEMTTNSPQFISSLTSYPQQGTNHSGWKKDDIYILADENHGLSLKIIDISDLTNLQVIALFDSDVHPNSIAHNLIIRDNFVYVSYYHDGLQIFDISDPYNPVKAGYYDTYLLNNHIGFAGNWGVDPQLPSGIILASDIQSGLFILDFNYNEEFICDGDSLLFDSLYINTNGFHISHTIDSLGYQDINVIKLSSLTTTSTVQYLQICNGDSIIIGSNVYSNQGNFIDSLNNINGCDSIINTNISINYETYSYDTIISNNSIQWNDMYLEFSGNYSDTLSNSYGCDSIINLNLTILNTTGFTELLNKRNIIKIIDVLGIETVNKKNKTLFYIYDDGSVEKKIIIE